MFKYKFLIFRVNKLGDCENLILLIKIIIEIKDWYVYMYVGVIVIYVEYYWLKKKLNYM